jgi:pre-mRNA cleavage complex 2 protein Pcf11
MDLQTKLKALVDLQQVLRQQQLPPEALQAVRDQVRALQMSQPLGLQPQTQPQAPVPLPVQMSAPPAITVPPPVTFNTPVPLHYAPPPPVSQPTPPVDLASLLASVSRNLQSQPSNQPTPSPQISIPQPSSSAPPQPSENPLFDQLRRAGLLGPSTPAGSTNPIPIPPPIPQPAAPPVGSINLSDLLKKVVVKPTMPNVPINTDKVELNSASLKM